MRKGLLTSFEYKKAINDKLIKMIEDDLPSVKLSFQHSFEYLIYKELL